ncbi:MAG: hypothetical protein QOJ56_512 [Mycobacterium sp.]|nr:hypothetical protein [Mycobacterium sp.]MDT5233217.1 hypothetical protein [Mycobacterium sp.]MDT5351980.1 hypothetical protein [Mycobacterium sp.]
MTNVFDAISPEFRTIIVQELKGRNPALFNELHEASEPTNDQSDAVVDVLGDALSANYGPGHIPNEYGKLIDNAIGAYLLAWPIHR